MSTGATGTWAEGLTASQAAETGLTNTQLKEAGFSAVDVVGVRIKSGLSAATPYLIPALLVLGLLILMKGKK